MPAHIVFATAELSIIGLTRLNRDGEQSDAKSDRHGHCYQQQKHANTKQKTNTAHPHQLCCSAPSFELALHALASGVPSKLPACECPC